MKKLTSSKEMVNKTISNISFGWGGDITIFFKDYTYIILEASISEYCCHSYEKDIVVDRSDQDNPKELIDKLLPEVGIKLHQIQIDFDRPSILDILSKLAYGNLIKEKDISSEDFNILMKHNLIYISPKKYVYPHDKKTIENILNIIYLHNKYYIDNNLNFVEDPY